MPYNDGKCHNDHEDHENPHASSPSADICKAVLKGRESAEGSVHWRSSNEDYDPVDLSPVEQIREALDVEHANEPTQQEAELEHLGDVLKGVVGVLTVGAGIGWDSEVR